MMINIKMLDETTVGWLCSLTKNWTRIFPCYGGGGGSKPRKRSLASTEFLISEQKDALLSEAIARVDDLYQLLDWSSSGRQERSHQPLPAELSHQMKMGKNRGAEAALLTSVETGCGNTLHKGFPLNSDDHILNLSTLEGGTATSQVSFEGFSVGGCEDSEFESRGSSNQLTFGRN
ncbi:hypothetical protein MRB53_014262 [Persea americana]|uniref:Uncharacterized protein n=1 Tax=Persea americana TaxID=3435 RepID=A0ACC2KAI2_PERAE|nr:hypothetical protein MRB53_014262 [Persea americana]